METKTSPYFSHLKCRECGRPYPKKAVHVCDFDFGPLEAAYDYDAIRGVLSRSDMTLCGVQTFSPDKAGRDAAELIGWAPCGTLLTTSLDDMALLITTPRRVAMAVATMR